MNYIPIRAYDNYVYANMKLSLLKEAGIDCHMKDEYTVTIDPLLSPMVGGMKVMVEERDLERAEELLKEGEQLYLESIPCPVCKQAALEFVSEITRYDKWIDKIRSRLINGDEEPVKTYYRC